MYSWPSASQIREPDVRETNCGAPGHNPRASWWPYIALGMTCLARCKSESDKGCVGAFSVFSIGVIVRLRVRIILTAPLSSMFLERLAEASRRGNPATEGQQVGLDGRLRS